MLGYYLEQAGLTPGVKVGSPEYRAAQRKANTELSKLVEAAALKPSPQYPRQETDNA